MDSYRYRNQQRSQDPLERRMGKWIETGRQLVDGVSGMRPGKRKFGKGYQFQRPAIDNVGRWVGEKIDWFLEEEEDWFEPCENEQTMKKEMEGKSYKKKRPLQAISLRGPRALSASSTNDQNNSKHDWPDQSSFRYDKWQRSIDQESDQMYDIAENYKTDRSSLRPIPRSSRRRI